jgi:hypothetical protein
MRRILEYRRANKMTHVVLELDTFASMLIDVEAYRLHEDRAKKRRADSARAGLKAKPRIDLDNVDKYDQP